MTVAVADFAANLPWPPGQPASGGLREAAQELETAFLAEMLKLSGLNEVPSAFGGGPGESQFASFLVREQAREITRAGGLGLSEVFFHAMVKEPVGETDAG